MTALAAFSEWRRRLRTYRGPARRRRAYSYTGEEGVIARLLADLGVPRFCVDLGASDGQTMSNTLALFQQGWKGFSVEMDGKAFGALAARHAGFPGSSLFRGRISPDNVLKVLQAGNVPRDCGFLTLDIDGYDFFVLDEVLTAYRPALICAEINEKVPPPLRFTVNYDPEYSWDGSHFYGQSICQLKLLCDRYDYAIVELEYNNAFLMPTALAPASLDAHEAYWIGYADRPDRHARFPWNADMEPLQGLDPDTAVDFLHSRFAKYRGSYSLDAGE